MREKKIKVLIIAGSMNVGGIENQLMHLLRNVDRNTFQIDFTTTADHPYYEEEILSLGGKCIRIPSTDGKHLLRYCKAIRHVMRDGQYDIVHSHELFHSGLVVLTAWLAGVKHRFVHAHSSNQGIGKSLIRRSYIALMRKLILWFGTEFLACSSLAAEFLYGKKLLNNPKYHLVVNSVETDRFLPLTGTEHPGTGPDSWKTVLQVGRFRDEKNFLFTTQIAAECKKRGDRIRFYFVGNDDSDNPYEQAVRHQIAENGLQDTVQLLGVRKDVDVLMKQADAFILPSKYEGMPLTLIEAQAACLPCIVADTFSHEADFGVGAVRWMSLAEPVSAWADAVELGISGERPSPDVVRQKIVEKGFDVKEFANTICSLYLQAVHKEKL